MNWIQEASKEKTMVHEILSFQDYMNRFKKRPLKETRPTGIYFKEMFDFFGKDEKGHFKLFLNQSPDCRPVYGQAVPQEQIYQNLINFVEEGFNNKFLLLVGPNGSAKTSIVHKIMEAAEEYSLHDEGALYSFSWIFPIDSYIKGGLGLANTEKSRKVNSYALLEDKDISSILNSELKDSPLLLIPLTHRRKLLDKLLNDFPNHYESIKKSYFYNGDLSARNRMIFDALLKSYQGDYEEVLKHIRVERFSISRRYANAAVTIEPQLHVDLRMQQITMDRRLASLPPSLQSLNLFSVSGENVAANRGILEFSDLLKRPLDAFKYLLMTMESRTINLQGILTELDTFFVGSSNEVHLAAFKQHPDFHSFRGRFNFIRVPYLLSYEDEMNIYQEQISNCKSKVRFEPHALETLCLWSVMTRLRPCLSKNYSDKRMGELMPAINPLEKALILANHTAPKQLSSDDRKLIRSYMHEIENEFKNDAIYEGKFGISPREIKQILYELGASHPIITHIDVLEYLNNFVNRKNEHEFLNISPQGDYTNPVRSIELLKEYQLDIFDQEMRDSLGLVDDRSYEDYISRYVHNVNSYMKGEKVLNAITGRYEDVDLFSVKEFENNIKLTEAPEIFRSNMLSTLGAYKLDNPDRPIIYTEVFSDIVKRLKESFREEQRRIIEKIASNLVFYLDTHKGGNTGTHSGLSEKNRQLIDGVLKNLQKNFHYGQMGAMTLVKYLIKERY